MPEWSTACPDWAERLKAGRSIIPPPIFPEEAEKSLAVMRELRIVDAPGSPTIGEACGDWVFELAASIFGAYDAEGGRRLITEWFVLIPKKNFKSGLAASIMLTSLILNWRQSAEFTILAPTLEVANNSFGPCRDMVQYEDEDEPNDLNDLIQVQTHVKTLTHREKKATLKVVATDSNTVAGKKSVGTLVDELWLFGKQPNAENMLREAIGGLASRPEGFVIYLTTQSDEPPAGVFKQKLQYARDVRDGKIHDPCFVPVLYEHPPEMVKSKACLELENLPMVNPNLGRSVDPEFLDREFRKAHAEGQKSLIGFLAKHGNVEIGMALGSDRWAGAEHWLARGNRCLTLEELLARSEVVDLGIDGGGLDDWLGFGAVGRERGTSRWLHWGRAWAHPSVLERRKSEAPRFLDFAEDGDLVIVENIGDDVDQLTAIVVQVYASGLLDKIGVDPSGVNFDDDLVAAGIPEDMILGVSQGWKLGGTIKTVERKLAEGAFEHGDRPMMAWCIGNAKVEQRANSILITKQASGTAKIDPLMALLNAAHLMSLNPGPKGRSFWDEPE
ncbi:terminase large subunit [Cupriavidus basilensis]|uniref:terminase large subunit n=1 Tax=Cupriavidus basilensis TaxID=68895 RepID=UPI00283DB0F8|nr:terminase large subunit [Cupriavidus basilensis]MDR3381747.1 terminase large subunit [Cupriavidus basilensis]